MLDSTAPSSQDVTLTVPASGTIPIKIIRSGALPGGVVTLDVTEFEGEQGASVPVTFSLDAADGTPTAHREGITFAEPLLSLHLQVPTLPTAGKYIGRLILTVPGQNQFAVWRFILTSANELRPATLVLDQGTVAVTAVRAWCLYRPWPCTCFGKDDRPVVVVHVRDKTGNWSLDGVTVRFEPGMKASGAGFDPNEHLHFAFNGTDVPAMGVSPAVGERSVAARQQATMWIELRGLEVGEYTIPLRFSAMNSGADDLQRLMITVQVRESVVGAIIVLILAALLSLLATRVVSMLRQRAAFLARVRAMRRPWLARETPTLSVIWLHATLRQTEDLSKRFWLTGQSAIDTRLAAAAGMAAVLDQIQQVRAAIKQYILEMPVRRRALWALDGLVQQLDASALTDQEVARYKTQLDALAAWTDPAKREASYWTNLLARLHDLASIVQTREIPQNARPSAQELLDKLNQAIKSEPADLNGKIAVEEDYARLRIVWDLHTSQTDVNDLVPLLTQAGSRVEDFYKVADDAAWKRLQSAARQKQIRIQGPAAAGLDALEAYDPITFSVEIPGDPSLLGTYLMQKKLEYRWTIKVKPQAWWRKSLVPTGELKVVSMEPQVAQYSPRAAQLTAAVEIYYEGQKGASAAQEAPTFVRKTTEFRAWHAMEKADLLAFVAALLVSVISGIGLYALAPTFGSLKDYLALFTWAAGFDQGKNFLQSLAAYNK